MGSPDEVDSINRRLIGDPQATPLAPSGCFTAVWKDVDLTSRVVTFEGDRGQRVLAPMKDLPDECFAQMGLQDQRFRLTIGPGQIQVMPCSPRGSADTLGINAPAALQQQRTAASPPAINPIPAY